MPIMIRLWEVPRAPEVLRWQQEYRVEWDATDGRNGQIALCGKPLSHMRRFDYRAGEKDQGTITLVLDVAKTLQRVSLPVVWAWATFPKRFCVCSAVTSSIRGEFNLKDVQRSCSRPSRPFFVGRIWSCLLPRFQLQDTLSEVMNVFPPLKFECVCG